jgi:hypothetical protein
MPEFETTLRILITIGVATSLILTAGLLFKQLFRKPRISNDVADRLSGIEAKIGEIEERLDFTERVLTDVKSRVQIPPKQ